MTSKQVGTTTMNFGEGKSLSSDIRGTSPAEIERITARLQHIKDSSKDWIVPSPCLTAVLTEGTVKVRMDHPNGDKALFGVNNIASEQFAEKLGIPMAYYRRMLADAPGLLAHNLNNWLVNEPQTLMVRTLDGNIRAVLSQRYRALDSHDFLMNVFMEGKAAGAVPQRLDLSESRFFLRMLAPDFAAKITGRGEDLAGGGKSLAFSPGYKRDDGTWQGPDSDDPNADWCFPVAVCSNSDVGRGGLNVEIGALRTTCSNLILVGATFHKVHIGEALSEGLVQLSNETRQVKDQALWLEVRDVVRAAFNEEAFKSMLQVFNGAQSQELETPVEAVDVVCRTYGFSEDDKEAILNELMSSSFSAKPGATVWGLSNAVNVLQHSEGVDRSYELARVGGEIITKGKELFAIR